MNQQHNSEKIAFIDARDIRGDKFVYKRFNENTSPELAKLAQQIHAQSYVGEGFINEGAVTQNGVVSEDIDKARGSSVDYYLGYQQSIDGETIPRSTIRKVNIPHGSSIESLPVFKLCRDMLYDNEREWLSSLPHAPRDVKEISAFGHVPEVSARAGLELLRHVLQDSNGSGEIWFFSMVKEKYETLVNLFGSEAVRKIGEPVELDDKRVGNVYLVPTIVDTNIFYQQVLGSARMAQDVTQQKRFFKSLSYFTEGMTRFEMGEDVFDATEAYRLNPGRSIMLDVPVEEMIASRSYKPASDWTQPEGFDLSSWADRLEIKRRFQERSITKTIDPEITEELFELRHPELKNDVKAREEFVDEYKARGVRTGRWFHFPWSQSLVHYLDQDSHQELRTFRNRNMITADEQRELLDKHLVVTGLSVGSSVAEQIAYSGIGGEYTYADFDYLSLANTNRIKAPMSQVGMKKLVIMGQKISELDPYVRQTHLEQGITVKSLEQLATSKPDLIFDEVDDLSAKALLRRFAAEYKIPLVMATDVGNISIVDVERHDLGEVEPFNRRLSRKQIDAMLSGELSESERMAIVTKLAGLMNASMRLIESTMDQSLGGIPQLGTTASAGGVLAAVTAKEILLGGNVTSGRHVLNLRKVLKFGSQTSLRESAVIVRQFISQKR
jgi:hypothetical protein